MPSGTTNVPIGGQKTRSGRASAPAPYHLHIFDPLSLPLLNIHRVTYQTTHSGACKCQSCSLPPHVTGCSPPSKKVIALVKAHSSCVHCLLASFVERSVSSCLTVACSPTYSNTSITDNQYTNDTHTGARLQRLIRGAQRVILPDSGHAALLEWDVNLAVLMGNAFPDLSMNQRGCHLLIGMRTRLCCAEGALPCALHGSYFICILTHFSHISNGSALSAIAGTLYSPPTPQLLQQDSASLQQPQPIDVSQASPQQPATASSSGR